jgi:hypothetical protein
VRALLCASVVIFYEAFINHRSTENTEKKFRERLRGQSQFKL